MNFILLQNYSIQLQCYFIGFKFSYDFDHIYFYDDHDIKIYNLI